MITFYTIPRAFKGEFHALQSRAIMSWLNAVPGAQVVLFGDDVGVHQAAEWFGCVHMGKLDRNEHGTPLLNDAMRQIEMVARYDWLCEISADIVLRSDFAEALAALNDVVTPFVVGQRWDVIGANHIATAWDNGELHAPCGVDYFLYRRGSLGEIPPFAVGRTMYDQWLVWHAINSGMTVIDATDAITAVHIAHGYPAWEDGKQGLFKSEERTRNHQLAQATGMPRLYGINDAPYVLTAEGALVKRVTE